MPFGLCSWVLSIDLGWFAGLGVMFWLVVYLLLVYCIYGVLLLDFFLLLFRCWGWCLVRGFFCFCAFFFLVRCLLFDLGFSSGLFAVLLFLVFLLGCFFFRFFLSLFLVPLVFFFLLFAFFVVSVCGFFCCPAFVYFFYVWFCL